MKKDDLKSDQRFIRGTLILMQFFLCAMILFALSSIANFLGVDFVEENLTKTLLWTGAICSLLIAVICIIDRVFNENDFNIGLPYLIIIIFLAVETFFGISDNNPYFFRFIAEIIDFVVFVFLALKFQLFSNMAREDLALHTQHPI